MINHSLIPIVAIEDPSSAVPLAKVLLNAGIGIIEVTLRSQVALDAASRISAEVPDIVLGVGSVLNEDHVSLAKKAGAHFIVSPGISESINRARRNLSIPWLPGVMTPSEVMEGIDYGLDCLKLFPASSLGGEDYLKALSGPFRKTMFVPCGGILASEMTNYLRHENVISVGGGSLVPSSMLLSSEWDGIEKACRSAQKSR